jgi:hypothetical protein
MTMTTPRHTEATANRSRMQSKLDHILEKYQEIELNDDAPFVIYLTEQMLADIDACRRSQQEKIQRATWPSLN